MAAISPKPLPTLLVFSAMRSPWYTRVLEAPPGRLVSAGVVVADCAGLFDEFTATLSLPPGGLSVVPAGCPFRTQAAALPTRPASGIFGFLSKWGRFLL